MAAQFTDQDIIILGVRIHDLAISAVMNQVRRFLTNSEFNLIFTPNPEICLKAEADPEYRKLLNQSDLNIPDGVGLKLGAEILGQTINNRVTGVDLTLQIMELLNQTAAKIFIINKSSSLSSLALIKKTLNSKYPNLEIFGAAMDKFDLAKLSTQIINCRPDAVFAAVGAPEQEQLLVELQNRGLPAKLGLAVGGTFDFITGRQKRAPKWWRDLGMEWFYRLIKQPRRLSRITDATIKFPLVCRQWRKRLQTEYRENVVAVITQNNQYLIQRNRRFAGEHWQFPQGGAELNEPPEQTACREAAEELGAPQKLFKFIKLLPVEHSYDWPKWARLLYGYKGQQQKFALLEYVGRQSDFSISDSEEATEIKWVDKDQLIKYIHVQRQASLHKVLKYI